MTRVQRELLVDRYLVGEMNAIEEQEFFMIVATDNELLQTLRAHRLVERALTHDRDALPSGYVSVQERTLAMLAAMPRMTSSSELTPSTGTGVTGGTGGGWFAGSQILTWVAVASTAVVFSVVGFMGRNILPQNPSESSRRTYPDTLVMSPAPVTTPALSVTPIDTVTESVEQTKPDNASSVEVAAVTRTEPSHALRTNEATPARRVDQRIRFRAADSGSDEMHYDSAAASNQSVSVQRRDSIPSGSAGVEKIPQLSPKSDSIGFKATITLPDGLQSKKR